MRVLVVQNFDNTGLGQVGAALAEAGAEIDIRSAHLGEPLPESRWSMTPWWCLAAARTRCDDDEYPYIPAAARTDARLWRQRQAPCSASASAASFSPAPIGGENQIGGAANSAGTASR